MPSLSRMLMAVLATVAALVVAACGDSSSSTSTSASGAPSGADSVIPRAAPGDIPRLTWAMPYPVNSLDPAKGFDGSTLLGYSIGLEPLVGYNRDGGLDNLVAESWETRDARTYVYNLREGVTFWNGDPLTPEDVVYTLMRHKDPRVASQMASFYQNVASIRQTGPMQVTVTLTKPDSTWQFVPAFTSFVMQKDYIERVGNRCFGTPDCMTMGTGPYEFTNYVPDQVLEARRYEGYWGEKPAAEHVLFRTIPDDSTRLLALRSGEIDGAFVIPPEVFNQWAELPNAYAYTRPSGDSYMFFFNTTVEPFNDVHVRRAFAYSLDIDAIATRLLRGQAEPATMFVPKTTWNNLMSQSEIDEFYASLPQYEFDMEKAREELAQSRFADGFDVTVNVPSATDQLAKAALALGENLEQLGINLKVREIPETQWITNLYSHRGLTFETLAAASQFPDPSYFLSSLSETEKVENGTNYALFTDPEATRLYEQQRVSADQDERRELLKQLAEIAADQLPYLGVYWQDVNVAVSDKYSFDGLSAWYYQTNWASKVKLAASSE